MEITLGQYDNIQQYLDGKMEPDQAEKFLQELQSNKDLKDSFEFEKTLRENAPAIREAREIVALSQSHDQESTHDQRSGDTADSAYIRDIIRATQTPIRETNATQTPIRETSVPAAKVIPFSWARTAVAATLIIATAGIAYFYTLRNRPADPASLFAGFFKKDAPPEGNYPMLAQALTDYKHNNYTTLRNYDLENLPTLKGEDDQRQTILELGYYYKGIAYLATDEPGKATPSFQWVIDHAKTDSLIWKAQWYEALAFLKSSNIPAATGLLRSVSSNPKAEGYNRLATDLLNKLKDSH